MKIQRAVIERYCSLENVELKFNDLTILIGKNGSGKSSIMESLFKFFSDFNATGGGVPAGFSDYFWYKRDLKFPIKINIVIELSEDEYKSIFSLPEDMLKAIEAKLKGESRILQILRVIPNLQRGWITESLKWGEILLVKDDQVVGQDEITALLTPKEVTSHYILQLFTPQQFSGSRLLVDEEKRMAFHSNPQIDALAARNIIRTSQEALGQDYKQWCASKGITLMERPPQPGEIDIPIQPVSLQLIQGILNQITNVIRGKMRYVVAARDNKQTPGQRTPILDQAIINAERDLFNSTNRPDEIRKDKFIEWVRKLLQKEIVPNPSQILVRDHGLYVPISFLGGGEQELFYIMWNVLDSGYVYAIEEPENHFHPEYCKKFLKFLVEDLSKESQVIVSTHSPLIVDKKEVKNNWIVKRTEQRSEVHQIRDRDELKLILAELGMVPSDLFLKDHVIFVEGGTEKEAIIPIFSEKLGFTDITNHIMIKAVGGDRQFKNYLRIWLDLIEYSPIDYTIVMDKNSEDVAFDLIREMGVPHENIIVLEKGSIEDYYPKELIKSGLHKLFEIPEEQIKLNTADPIDRQIEQILLKNDKFTRWKIELAQFVATRMTLEQIPTELQKLLTSLKEKFHTQ